MKIYFRHFTLTHHQSKHRLFGLHGVIAEQQKKDYSNEILFCLFNSPRWSTPSLICHLFCGGGVCVSQSPSELSCWGLYAPRRVNYGIEVLGEEPNKAQLRTSYGKKQKWSIFSLTRLQVTQDTLERLCLEFGLGIFASVNLQLMWLAKCFFLFLICKFCFHSFQVTTIVDCPSSLKVACSMSLIK